MILIDVRDNFKSIEKNLGFPAKKQLPKARAAEKKLKLLQQKLKEELTIINLKNISLILQL